MRCLGQHLIWCLGGYGGHARPRADGRQRTHAEFCLQSEGPIHSSLPSSDVTYNARGCAGSDKDDCMQWGAGNSGMDVFYLPNRAHVL
jgi:hypothetical protein